MTDIKETLATAFTDEPPLTIDKYAIHRAGRRKVTTRYASIGSAVLVTAVVVSVPAMVNLGSGGGGGPDVGQASMTESQTLVQRTTDPLGTAAPLGTATPLGPGMSEERAAELTRILRTSGALPAMETHSPEGSVPWEFEAWGEFYNSHAEVFDERGSAIVSLQLVPRPYKGCDKSEYRTPPKSCEERTTHDGRDYKVELSPDTPGNMIRVTVKLPDGKMLDVQAQGIEDRSNGPYDTTPMPGGGPQPLTVPEVVKLATVPGLVF
ncbi:hypothetical protein F4560_006256 [Saccharothrix ecbatanensis]|uniref:Uncharacterized protein n=1 Tax=Saccharothrix ecbatanensis TaxID=1105145 RepID=A0A7W9M404_9PSEU|nr:hypothetical protein [Saccharothrix ecbatanensis]MBB5806488.1 hypothetical protein [Saccharothrix ecbatanensis]